MRKVFHQPPSSVTSNMFDALLHFQMMKILSTVSPSEVKKILLGSTTPSKTLPTTGLSGVIIIYLPSHQLFILPSDPTFFHPAPIGVVSFFSFFIVTSIIQVWLFPFGVGRTFSPLLHVSIIF